MKINKNTLAFVEDLAANNNRDWFTQNKAKYEQAKDNISEFMNVLQDKLNETDVIEGHKLFRIYRDVRFSKDKRPYKEWFSGYYKRAGESRRGGYYFHIAPGASVIGGGFYGPNKEDLMRIRKEFEMDGEEMNEIVNHPQFKQMFGDMLGDGVKTAPKGFAKDHPNIHWIKKKQWFVRREFTDKEVLSDHFMDEVQKTYMALEPFFNYFTEILTTDLNGESIL